MVCTAGTVPATGTTYSNMIQYNSDDNTPNASTVLAKGRNYILYTPWTRIFYFSKRNNNNCVNKGSTVTFHSCLFLETGLESLLRDHSDERRASTPWACVGVACDVMNWRVVVDFYGALHIRCRNCRSALPACLKALQARFWPSVMKFVVQYCTVARAAAPRTTIGIHFLYVYTVVLYIVRLQYVDDRRSPQYIHRVRYFDYIYI
jgi:hypothetical protein